MNVYEVNDIGHSKILLMFVSILSSYFPAIYDLEVSSVSAYYFTAMSLLTQCIHLLSFLLSSGPAHEGFTAVAIGLSGILLA